MGTRIHSTVWQSVSRRQDDIISGLSFFCTRGFNATIELPRNFSGKLGLVRTFIGQQYCLPPHASILNQLPKLRSCNKLKRLDRSVRRHVSALVQNGLRAQKQHRLQKIRIARLAGHNARRQTLSVTDWQKGSCETNCDWCISLAPIRISVN